MIRISIIILAIALVAIIFGCSFQTKMIFPAEKLNKDHVFTPFENGEEVSIRTEDDLNLNAMKYSNFKSKKIILFFHGNAGSLESWRYEYRDLEYLKKDVLILDFRGYGKSEGKVSEGGLYKDGRAALKYLNDNGYNDSDIIVYGRSIGCGIAVDLAQNKHIDALILESPFSSLRKVVYKEFWYMLPYFYLKYKFNNCEKIKNAKTKDLIIHGTEDEVISYKYGNELYSCYDGEKVFQAIKGGHHNDLDQFEEKREAISSFLGTE